MHREGDPKAGVGVPTGKAKRGKIPSPTCQTHGGTWTALSEIQGTKLNTRYVRWQGRPQALTRPQVPTCQARSLRRGQSSRTQGSVRGGRSSKEHAVAWSTDPSSPWQVTVRLRTPEPQLTEHCKDPAVSRSSPPPPPPTQGSHARLDSWRSGMKGGQHSRAHVQLPSPERLTEPSEATQPES